MRKKLLTLFAVCMAFVAAANAQTATETEKSKVYFTSDISPESLVKIYNALGKEATGKVAVKISTGESSQSNHLRPGLPRSRGFIRSFLKPIILSNHELQR